MIALLSSSQLAFLQIRLYNKDMGVITIPMALREKLGEEATEALIMVISEAGFDMRRDLPTDISNLKEDVSRIETRLEGAIARIEEDADRTETRLKEDIAGTKTGLRDFATRDDISRLKEDMSWIKAGLEIDISILKKDVRRIEDNLFKRDMLVLKLYMVLSLMATIALFIKTFLMH
ncbi:MAG: hypothetical protein HQL05_10710 [Nitrospirae bacterium]|uniref:LA_3696 family protein n=1 Tax=Candidatus Magnetobacterium casense TaxID=1455061 RepID=UPI00058E0F93|nr:hypothetical protein [Candidatus Magnetobacterium casensis]MBF0338290.1 hypothetical protein [Nitrospirota bacterium]